MTETKQGKSILQRTLHVTKKILRVTGRMVIWSLAAYGAALGCAHLLLTYNMTKESGVVDANSDYFNDIHNKYNLNFRIDSGSMRKHRYEILDRLLVVDEFNPKNAQMILEAYLQSGDERIALRMLDAVDRYLTSNKDYVAYQRDRRNITRRSNDTATNLSVYEWMNIEEWSYLKEGIARHKRWIDSAARATGVEARMIVCCLVGEQVRKFNSRREKYKGFVAPLKTLSLSTMFSYGVAGIKEGTARAIEENLKDSTSVYYLGKEYEHLLDYDTLATYSNALNDTLSVRVQRLTQLNNNYYSYLYTALFIKQIMTQWSRQGYSIEDRPEILATIFNLGYAKSKPKANPEVGGAVFNVREKQYTFGAIAYEFYYSGELLREFPYSVRNRAYDQPRYTLQ